MAQANASVGNITVGFNELQRIAVNLFSKTDIRAIGVEGPPGGGKTALGMSIADLMSAATGEQYNTFQINLSQHEPTDVSGVPYVQNGRMKKALTDWWPTEPNNIIVLEEITKGPKLMQNAIGEAIHEGTIGSFKLPANTYFYLSWNRKADGAGDEKVLSHFVNRLVYFNYYPRPSDLIDHMMTNAWNPVLIAFLNNFKHLIFDEKTFTNNGARYNAEKPVFATPRSWEKVSQILNLELPLDLEIPTIAGCVGEGACRELVAYKEMMKDMPDIDECINRPTKAKLPTESSVKYALSLSLSFATTKENRDNVMEYITRLPKEFQVLWIKALAKRAPTIIDHSNSKFMELSKGLKSIVMG
jgi:hypothetical protein